MGFFGGFLGISGKSMRERERERERESAVERLKYVSDFWVFPTNRSERERESLGVIGGFCCWWSYRENVLKRERDKAEI